MEIHNFVEFKQRELKRLKLEEELIEQLCNWLDDVTNKLTLLNIEWQANYPGGYNYDIDKGISFTIFVGNNLSPVEFQVRKISDNTYIYTILDVHCQFFKKQEYKYNDYKFATREFMDKIGGKK